MKVWVLVLSPSKESGTRPLSCPSIFIALVISLVVSWVAAAVATPPVFEDLTLIGLMDVGLILAAVGSVVGR